LEKNRLNIPLSRIIAPTVITTDFKVNPGRVRKRMPIARVRMPLMNAFWGEGRKNIFMAYLLK
jgi:hypothetical protein